MTFEPDFTGLTRQLFLRKAAQACGVLYGKGMIMIVELNGMLMGLFRDRPKEEHPLHMAWKENYKENIKKYLRVSEKIIRMDNHLITMRNRTMKELDVTNEHFLAYSAYKVSAFCDPDFGIVYEVFYILLDSTSYVKTYDIPREYMISSVQASQRFYGQETPRNTNPDME